jgi:hypothetical protein
MCPVCITTAVLISGGVTTASGFAAMAIKMFGVKNTADNHPPSNLPELLRKKNGAGELVPNAKEKSR